MNLEIKVKEKANEVEIDLIGEIDAYTAPDFKESLLRFAKTKNLLVEVNMEKVSYMDSTGLGVIISALKASKDNKSELRLVNLQSRVMRLFEITGLDSVFTIDSKVRGGNE